MDDKVLIIEPGRVEQQYFKDLWRYRELFLFLAWRDILVRYKQTVFGILWAVMRPFLTMVVFTVVFSGIAKLPSNGVPYPILVYAAMLPWQFFSSSFSESSNSLIGNSNLLTKIYFPPVHLTHYYHHELGYRVSLPVTESAANDIVSLPIYPGMPVDDIEKVVQVISEYYGGN